MTRAAIGATVLAAFGRQCLVRTDAGETLHCRSRGRLLHPACGDRALLGRVAPGEAVIEALAPRSSEFARSSRFRTKVLAANLTQVIVLTACEPSFSDELVSRVLVAAERAALPAVLVLNKIDLVERLGAAREALAPFRALGYPLVELSGKLSAEPLRRHLGGHRSLLVGQSGMGKSTLVKKLVPDAEVKIAEISRFLDSGRQATTVARLYAVDERTEIVDSPGLAEFGLAGLSAREIAAGFAELATHAPHCRFQDCRHLAEPGCAVRAAVESGAVHPRRLALYQRIVRLEKAP
ncbi:MAG: ribosome small subunit-dependent GTPase A [Betaproteobacteria bacterium]|nr:ribosome small subunit-dependent GTPase A [Betaproteobacteria bacterium]